MDYIVGIADIIAVEELRHMLFAKNKMDVLGLNCKVSNNLP